MGFLDKIKGKMNQGDDDLDELDSDSDSGEDREDGDDEPSASSGGGALGLLNRVKKLSSGGEDDEGGGIGALLGKVKGLRGRIKDSEDLDLDDDAADTDADDTTPNQLDVLDADEADENSKRPIRRSGIAAKLDGKTDEAESPKKDDDDGEAKVPVPIAAGGGGLDLDSLFEEELVINPTLKDLAESLDNVSAVELAADLRTFLDELQ